MSSEQLTEQVTVVEVDFNSEASDGTIPADGASATGPLAVGRHVVMIDAEGNACRGRVLRLDGDLAYIEPSWPSWVAGAINRDPEAQATWDHLSVSPGAARAR